MEAICSVILKANRSYNNKEVINGTKYTVNVSIDNVQSINRTAEIVVAPLGSGLASGDEVLIHHNILRENIQVNDLKTKGNFHINGEFYRSPVSEILMKRVNGKWETLLDFVFLKPIKEQDVDLGHGLILTPHSRKGFQDLRATLAITNKKLKGVDIGDTVIFSRNSEHEFLIDGETMYKCEVQDILAKLK